MRFLMRFLVSLPQARRGVLALAAAAALAASPALAQGTDEQREACAPDAIKLCQDTIPDVATTTACMKRHYAQLSPRCRSAFNEAVGSPSGRAARRESPRDFPPAAAAPETDTVVAGPERVPGLHAYEAHIRDLCRQGLVDSFTCRNTLDALKLSE